MKYNFRIAKQSDSMALRNLWEDTYRQAYRDVHDEGDIQAYVSANHTMDRIEAVLNNPDMTCIIAERDGELLGYFLTKAGQTLHVSGARPVELKQIYILKSEYGKGLGQQLLDKAIQTLKTQDHDTLWLAVSVRNGRAQAFYLKNEFTDIGNGPVFHVGQDLLRSKILERPL